MKHKICCIKWRDINNHDYTITHPNEDISIDNRTDGGILFDKRRIRYCPECGRPLYTILEILNQIFLD